MTETTPLQPDPDGPASVDVGENQDEGVAEEYFENTEDARENILESGDQAE